MSLITVIGRGHGGTRAMSHTLSESGVFMGADLNESGDLIPPEDMYEACRVLARGVRWKRDLEWDFGGLHDGPIAPEFERLLRRYLRTVLESDAEQRGWKIPETTLCYPWIARMFPRAKYIIWVRDPRDSILGRHVTDDLGRFGIRHPQADDVRRRRAISWLYQHRIVQATPQPEHTITVRFEDFVLRQDETLGRLEKFLGFPLAKIPVRTEPVGRWKSDDGRHDFDFLKPAMIQYGYIDA
ncbi:MAG: sulfotransferase family protein [Planctomycetota bacterium]